ncbi:MAG TPA: sigma 54-interacting transcriptional regulator [Candidatus Bathyarchaeia archaeon]|nr:sigma 54-interacting transcriptional regulator [Candidatus Bathyarchaeia archaeon]
MADELATRGEVPAGERRVAEHQGGVADLPELYGVLLEVLRATASHRDLPGLLRELASILRRVARFDRLGIVLHDPARDVMRLHTLAAFGPTQITEVELPTEESPAGIAWQTQQPIVVQSIEREARFAEVKRILRADGMRSFCVLPLTSPLRRLGGLSFSCRDENAFRPADVELLQQFTRHVALAVDNTLHHEAAQRAQQDLARERDRLQLLLEVNNALVSNLERRALFSAIAACLRRVLAHDYTSLAVYDARRDAFDLWAIEFTGAGLVHERMAVPVLGSPAGTAFAAGKPVRLARSDLVRLSSDVAGLLLAEGIQSMCCVPLTVRERRLGTLNVGRLGDEPFTAEDEELLATVANQVAFSVENAVAFQEIAELKDKLAAEKVYLEDEIRTDYNFEEIIGESPTLKRLLHGVETVAPTESTVLIRGETGTGKELIARALHELSRRRERTFVKVNCAAIPTGLLESELFGHERGAFTGAIAQRIGRFELANGGTLFLDEVGDIPLELQPKLLRVLQEQEFERLGSPRTIRVDTRVVAATNRNLEEMVAAGTFRSDLYYRLNVFPVALPPLRERSDDIPHLVRYFTQKFARRMNKRIETIPAEAMAALVRYDWPGNVRELENALERAVILTSGPVLQIPVAEFRGRASRAAARGGTLEATEREAILRALRDAGWVLAGPRGAAAQLGLKRTTLQSRMRKLGISRPRA